MIKVLCCTRTPSIIKPQEIYLKQLAHHAVLGQKSDKSQRKRPSQVFRPWLLDAPPGPDTPVPVLVRRTTAVTTASAFSEKVVRLGRFPATATITGTPTSGPGAVTVAVASFSASAVRPESAPKEESDCRLSSEKNAAPEAVLASPPVMEPVSRAFQASLAFVTRIMSLLASSTTQLCQGVGMCSRSSEVISSPSGESASTARTLAGSKSWMPNLGPALLWLARLLAA